MVRKLAFAVSLALGTLSVPAHALGLGELSSRSALNQNFEGDISLLSVEPEELDAVRVRLAERNGRVEATSTGNQSSGVLRSMVLADGLMIFPAEATEMKADAEVCVQVIDEQFFASTESGV